MSDYNKISHAFELFLEKSGPNDRHDAIVIYRAPNDRQVRVRGRLKKLKQRLDFIKNRASVNQPIQKKFFKDFHKLSDKLLPKSSRQLEAFEIGANTLPVASVQVTRKTLPALAKQPDVVAILPNQKINLIKPKAVEYSELRKQENKDKLTWGLKQLKIPEMWETTKGKDINVAVLDTGVHSDHPLLKGKVKEFIVVDPLGRRINANPAFDSGQHGTHVCGTIAGGETEGKVSVGVAPEADLLVAGVLVGDANMLTLLEGITWAVEKGADIINMSLGFTYYEPLFAEIFNQLIEQFEILPVVAVGNENHGNTSSPGNAKNAFSIGAVEKLPRSKLDIAFFSSGASLVFPDNTSDNLVTKPDVAAPGVQIYSCIPPEKTPDGVFQYTYMDGSSMATPHAAGVAALLMSACPDREIHDIIKALKDTALHPGGKRKRPDNRWGYGIINPVGALKALN